MARRRKAGRDETEMTRLLNSDDETLTDEAGWSTAFNEPLRLMVLGGDDALMDKACATILGERERRDAFQFGNLEPRNAQVCGRKVSVLKTPFSWLEHLKSYYIFSNGVKSMKDDLQYYELLLFPGPHAFLLVHRDVKNSQNYLLRALCRVFGKEVLDYCMVLFIDEAKLNDPKKNSCLKMCGGRHHILQNTDKSVHQLFRKMGAMTQWKSSDFFLNNLECFRKAENYFKEKNYERRRQYRETIENLNRDMNVMKEQNAEQVTELNERINNEVRKLAKSKDREIQTKKDFQELKDRERQLIDDKEKLQRDVEQATYREAFLHSKLQSEFNMIQREGEVQAKEKELREKERELDRRAEELDERQRKLEERQKQLEIRERKLTQREPEQQQSTADTASVSGDKTRPLDECEGELKSREHYLAVKSPVRRNSKELEPPDMSEHGPMHTL